MRTRFNFVTILFFFSWIPVFFAQQTAESGGIKGMILDEDGTTPIEYANILLSETDRGTTSTADGQFLIGSLAAGEYTLILSYLGYESTTIEKISVGQNEVVDLGKIILVNQSISLKEVVVSPGSYSIIEKPSAISQLTLTEQNIRNMAWAEDITRAVSRLPGISASDYSSKFAIRGGEADEVLISLDGMELYEPFHQRDYSGGLFSIVDIEAIRGIDLMTGGFSVEHGNRLSGNFAMRTKNVADNEQNLSLGLSIMNAGIYGDGKFGNNKGSYVFTARRGMLDLVLKTLGNDEYFPKFYDGFGKVDYQLNNKHQLSIHFLKSGDRAFINNSPTPDNSDYDQYDSKYDNTYGWLTLKSIYNQRLYSRTILYSGNINHDRSGGFDKYEYSDKGSFRVNDQRDFNFTGIKQDWSYEMLKKLHLKLGWELKTLNATYDYVNSIHELRINSEEKLYNFDRDLDIKLSPSGEQLGVYLNTRIQLMPKLIAEAGMRYDMASYTGDKNWSPRASMVYAFSKRSFLRAGWGYYYQTQFINTIDVNNGDVAFNAAELAKHYVLGFEHSFRKGISLRSEVYYKDMSNISPLWQNLRDHLENYPEARNDNARVVFNGITSKGIEVFLKYDQNKAVSWWFSYALAKATDDIKDIEFDGLLVKRFGKVPRLNDQRHTIYADINYRPGRKWHYSASFQFYRGWPRTDYTYRFTYLPNDDLHFYQAHGKFNDVLYPAYHRLDIRINRNYHLRKSQLTAFLHVVNVYNRQNLKKFDLDAENEQGEPSIDDRGNYVPTEDHKYWLGIIPVFGVRWALLSSR